MAFMTDKFYKPGQPVVIGLCGKAGTGKTVTAETLVPGATARIEDEYWWDHKFFAIPLYEMAAVRRDIDDSDRRKHLLHGILSNMFSGCDKPTPYKTLVRLVNAIDKEPIDLHQKPRSFLQNVGTMCRKVNKDCYTSYIYRAIIKDTAWAADNDRQYVCVVSDVRMTNEAKLIDSFSNGVVVELLASDEVRQDRLVDRDGYIMSTEQSEHASERTDLIKRKYITASLDTDNLGIDEQATEVLNIVNKTLGASLA